MKIFNESGKKIAKIAGLGIFLVPSIVSAQLVISGPATLTPDPIEVVLGRVISGILGIIGVLGILYLVYGTIKYITSAGNDSDIEEAKKVITYAIWGLFLTASAYAIVQTVISFAG